ncbi:MAG: hypothetical protein U0Y08_03030 [Bacteroidia bacterium]
MNKLISIALLMAALFLQSSCSKDESAAEVVPNYGLDYFPDDSGIVRYYHVDSTYWDDFTHINSTVSYELKEVLAGHFIDDQGRNAMRIERYRQDSTGNWVIYRVWSSVRTNDMASVTEENIPLVKLRFPSATGISWNGNAYNAEGEQIYEIISMDTPGSVNGMNFTQTLKVRENDIENAVEARQQEAKYAKSIGAFYKLKTSLTFELPSGDTLSGYIYTEKLTSYSLP